MRKKEHLDYLKKKYDELKEKYVHELIYGKSLAQIKDISEVLESIRLEIETLEKDQGLSPNQRLTNKKNSLSY